MICISMAGLIKLLIIGATALPSVYSEECDKKAALDVVFAIDNTASMTELIKRVRETLPPLVEEFDKVYPGSRYGFYTLNDKNDSCISTWPNFQNGHCNKLELELTSDAFAAKNGLANVSANVGGRTAPEDSLGALLVASHNSNWRHFTEEENILRIIILVTDNPYNQPGDVFNCKGPNFRPNDGDATYDCTNEDYPSVEQVKAIMSSKKILPLFLTVNNQADVYQELLNRLGLGGLSKDLSDSSTSVFEVIKDAVGTYVCATTTTTTATTTTATTTTATTTTATTTTTTTTTATTTTAATATTTTTSLPTTPAPTTTIKPSIPATIPAGGESTEAEVTTAWAAGGGGGGDYETAIIIGAATAGAVVVAGVAGGLILRAYMASGNAPAPTIEAHFDDLVQEPPVSDREQMGALDLSAYVQ